jgi:aminoglycoside 3-N-acetyltransferase
MSQPNTFARVARCADSQTLLLGVGFNRCSSLHYAESLVPNRRTTISRFPMMRNGERVWVEKPDMAFDNGQHFPLAGEKFLLRGRIHRGRIGNADALLFSTRELVEFAESYFSSVLG